MKALTDAIYTRVNTASVIAQFPAWTDNSTGTTLSYPVGYYVGLAPERAPLPYVVATVITSTRDTYYGGNALSQPQIQFAAYGVGYADVYTRLTALLTVLDDYTLTLATGHTVNTQRITDPIPTLQGDDETSSNVWQWVVTYQFAVSSR